MLCRHQSRLTHAAAVVEDLREGGDLLLGWLDVAVDDLGGKLSSSSMLRAQTMSLSLTLLRRTESQMCSTTVTVEPTPDDLLLLTSSERCEELAVAW